MTLSCTARALRFSLFVFNLVFLVGLICFHNIAEDFYIIRSQISFLQLCSKYTFWAGVELQCRALFGVYYLQHPP
ncbi:unnamed protein product [Haemonchus placei]|uniref:Secreted protein n=1 Tax=Haemonchus placei TaxID=6290 RepID=A0A0N4WCH9_HAEPC|nr:unnamed protein product [Haemonchus placei]